MKRIPLLLFLYSCLCTIFMTLPAFARNSIKTDPHIHKRIKEYRNIGLKMTFIDSSFELFQGTHLTVEKNNDVIFEGNLRQIEKDPDIITLGPVYRAFLFTTREGNRARTLVIALYDGKEFHVVDKVFLSQGSYKLKDLDSDGVKEILVETDFFPCQWTSCSNIVYDLAILKIDSVYGGITDVTSKYPDRVMKYIRSYQKKIREIQKNNMEDSLLKSGQIKQQLACLLVAYISLGKESEGWDILRKQYNYSDKEKYFKELEGEIARHTYMYGHRY
ncbi:MAG: hypothetical protein ACHQM6_05215 [Candidatus Kapaibacterium sp.]